MDAIQNNTKYVAETTIKTDNGITIYANEGVHSELYNVLEENNQIRCIENPSHKQNVEEVMDDKTLEYVNFLTPADKPRVGRPPKVENQDTSNVQNNKK